MEVSGSRPIAAYHAILRALGRCHGHSVTSGSSVALAVSQTGLGHLNVTASKSAEGSIAGVYPKVTHEVEACLVCRVARPAGLPSRSLQAYALQR